MKNDDEKTALRMDAAKTIIERVYGKPLQPIDSTISGGLDVGLSDADRQLLAKVEARLEGDKSMLAKQGKKTTR